MPIRRGAQWRRRITSRVRTCLIEPTFPTMGRETEGHDRNRQAIGKLIRKIDACGAAPQRASGRDCGQPWRED